jgi:hypothetical protein
MRRTSRRRSRGAGHLCRFRSGLKRTCFQRLDGLNRRNGVSSLLFDLWAAFVDVPIKPIAANRCSAMRAMRTTHRLLRLWQPLAPGNRGSSAGPATDRLQFEFDFGEASIPPLRELPRNARAAASKAAWVRATAVAFGHPTIMLHPNVREPSIQYLLVTVPVNRKTTPPSRDSPPPLRRRVRTVLGWWVLSKLSPVAHRSIRGIKPPAIFC